MPWNYYRIVLVVQTLVVGDFRWWVRAKIVLSARWASSYRTNKNTVGRRMELGRRRVHRLSCRSRHGSRFEFLQFLWLRGLCCPYDSVVGDDQYHSGGIGNDYVKEFQQAMIASSNIACRCCTWRSRKLQLEKSPGFQFQGRGVVRVDLQSRNFEPLTA